MELMMWFDIQLRSTLEGLVWSVRQIPERRWYAFPPASLAEWSAAQHLFHMVHYEENLALPSMHQWLGGLPGVHQEADQKDWENPPPMQEMLDRFTEVRLAEISLLPRFEETAWHATQKTTFWGEVSLYWLVCKTYQHTLDHCKDLLALALFWDRHLARMSRE